jgi:anti-anti-sigma factor
VTGSLATVTVDGGTAGARTVRLGGEIDLSNATVVEDEIRALTDGASEVTIDLAGLSYLDSQGMHLVQRLEQHYGERGVRCGVRAPADSFAGQVLEIVRPTAGGRVPWA